MEFLRVGLAVRICLEDKISPIFDGVIVSVKQSRTMSAVRLGKRGEKRACLGAITQDLVGIVFTAVIDDHQSGLSIAVIFFYNRIPFINGTPNIGFFIISRDYYK